MFALLCTCALCACGASTRADKGTGTAATGYNEAILAVHPAAFWDVSAAAISEPDLSGNGHTGTYRGGLPGRATLPDGEPAADFNAGSRYGQYLTMPSSPVFSIATTRELTFEAWIRPDALSFGAHANPNGEGYLAWMGKCESYSPSCEWEARMYSAVNPQRRCSRISAYVFNSTGGLGSGADWQPQCGKLRAGSWLYVVGEYQTRTTPSGCQASYPGTIDIWVDGVKQDFALHMPTGCMSQYRVVPTAGGSPVNIGTMARDSWFPGAIGKVAIYDTLLTQTQIDEHYRAMTGKEPSGRCADTCNL